MTLEVLNELAERTPDTKNTIPGEILFFRQNSSLGESLKKLKNHNFKIGYSFSVLVNGNEYTKIIAYNQKNDIFSGWSGFIMQDGEYKEVFPIVGNGFLSYLNMPRIDAEGKLKLYKESMVSLKRQTGQAKRMFENLGHLEEVDDISLYGYYWPVLENPDVEQFRRNQQQKDMELYCDVAYLCNIYMFDKTYMLLDEGLRRIYRVLFEKREELFCMEYQNYYDNDNVVQNTLAYLGLTEDDVREMFAKYNMKYPVKTERSNEWGTPFLGVVKKLPFYQKRQK